MPKEKNSRNSVICRYSMEKHMPVLVQEVIEHLNIQPGNVVLDGTLGLAGHAKHLVNAMRGGVFVGIDADANALEEAKQNLVSVPKGIISHFVEGNFRDIVSITNTLKISQYDRVLLDLGWGSHQLMSGRGFSFMRDESLDMCYGTKKNACVVNARDIVNSFEEKNLADIIKGYGGERWAVRIAKHIAEARERRPITTTKQLADIIAGAVPRRFHPKNIHIATRTFQAIRITVNDEINTLKKFLGAIQGLLQSEAHITIISFHSLEDRIVKRTFKSWEQEGIGKRHTKKALKPTKEECEQNPRSRSAKLRTFTIF